MANVVLDEVLGSGSVRRKLCVQAMAKSAMRQIVRGVLGPMLGGSRR